MIALRPLIHALNPLSFNYLVPTWFHSGRIRPMSGTWGSLAAIPFCLLIWTLLGKIGLAVAGIALFYAALQTIPAYLKHVEQLDPSEIVIDEVLGMIVMWLLLPQISFWWIFWGFAAFRIFDSIKVGPVGWCDKKIKGTLGIIIDDLVAGLMAGFLLGIVSFLLN